MIHQRHLLPINIVLWVLLTSVYSIKTNANEHKSLESMNRILLLSSSSDGADCSLCPIPTQDCSLCPIPTQDCSKCLIPTQDCAQCPIPTQDCSKCPIPTQDCAQCPIPTQDCSECPVITKDCPQDIITTQNKNECEFTFSDCSGLPCTDLVFITSDNKQCDVSKYTYPNPTISFGTTIKYCFDGIGTTDRFEINLAGGTTEERAKQGLFIRILQSEPPLVFYLTGYDEYIKNFPNTTPFGSVELCVTNSDTVDVGFQIQRSDFVAD
eukprot:800255_1